MINIQDKAQCTGCAACYSICTQKCIRMEENEEGFFYPEVNQHLCVNCQKCLNTCPLGKFPENVIPQTAYIIQSKDDLVRKESTSGGAFTVIASEIIKMGGVVFGAAFDEKLVVRHQYVDTIEDLKIFRNSKYVQSQIGETYREARNFLEKKQMVCYSGTNCQIEGLLSYLAKDYENLILVDVICRAVPSPLVFRKYIEWQSKKHGASIRNVKFRDKSIYGYKYSQLTLWSEKSKLLYHRGVESDPFLRSFFDNICNRPSCYQCQFKKKYRLSDITLWDCFEPDRFNKSMDDNKGTTRVLAHSNKGKNIIDKLNISAVIYPVTPQQVTSGFKEINNCVPKNPKRAEFMDDIIKLEYDKIIKKYYPDSIKVKIERTLRILGHKMRFYKFMRRFYRLLKNKE